MFTHNPPTEQARDGRRLIIVIRSQRTQIAE
jgi:hypothetical protein